MLDSEWTDREYRMKRWIGWALAICLLPCMALGEEDYVCAQPGDSGGDVRLVLETAYRLGFLPELAKDEDTYREEYIPAVQQLESALSLEADGVIRLSEIEEMDGLIYPGMSGEAVGKILNKLANLGYIKSLPDDQTVYDAKYVSAVKAAEKKLSLTEDGYLTASEQMAITKEKAINPDPVKNLKIASKSGKAVLTWSASKNAVQYTIERDSIRVAVVKGTTWTDNDVEMGQSYHYSVTPVRYGAPGKSASEVVYIDPVYKTVTLSELCTNRQNYNGKFVKIAESTVYSTWTTGNDYYIMIQYNTRERIYMIRLILRDYRDWDWDNGKPITSYRLTKAGGSGQVTEISGNTINIELSRITWRHK